MSSFDILAKETKLHSRLFLEASAGTGKTFTIEHIVVRLLLETSCTLDQILVVTFTRAATRELKERIRANLEKVCERKFDYLKDLTDQQLEKIKTALLTFDRSQIFTIHSFCSRLLQEFAFEASVGLELKEWDTEEEKWAILEFLRTSNHLSPQQLRRVLGSCKNDIEVLVKRLQSSSLEEGFSFEDLNTRLSSIPFFPVAEVFAEIRPHYKEMTSSDFEPQALLIQQALERKKFLPEELDRLIGEEDIFLEGIEAGNLKVRAKISGHPEMERLRDAIWPLLEEARDPRKILPLLSKHWQAEKKKLSRLNEKVSDDDLLTMVQERLEDSSFVAHVRKKYQAVIVDEFQDTDPVQWNIFETLFVADPTKAVYLVGDPKQSIYAFRQADIYTFLQAGKLFEQKAMLTMNFRSGQGLIAPLNKLFCSKPWLDLPKLQQSLSVPPVQAAKQQGGELCFMVAEGELGRGKRWPTPDLEQSLLFPYIVHEIARLQLEPSEIAILVKDRYQALRVKNYLAEWDIPCVLNRSTSLGESLVVDLLQEVIDACHGQDRTSAVKKIMLGPFVQMPLDAITDEAVFQIKMVFTQLADVWLKEGFAPFFAQFLQTKFWKEKVLTLAVPFYDDLMQIIEAVIFIQDPRQMTKALRDIKIVEADDRISAHPHGIQIMTMHASKGLEFETVFALGVASRTTGESTSQELDAEKMRQLYVALTRAKMRLYVPLLKEMSGKPMELGRASPMELFWQRVAPDLQEFTHVDLNQMEFSLQPYKIKEPPALVPPPSSQLLFKPIYLQSFSSLSQATPEKKSVHDESLPPGTETGIIIHAIFEKYFTERSDLPRLIAQEVRGTHLENYQPAILSMIEKVLDLSLDQFSLRQVKNVLPEMEFIYPANESYLKGFIDLCVEYNGKYYLIDWKTNVLDDYTPETVAQAMADHDYLLQGKIYSTALQRYLKIYGDLPFGGAYFIFVRGPTAFEVKNG